MHRVVREAVGRRILVIEARVSPEDIEQGATGAEVQHQAGAAHGEGGRDAAGLRAWGLVPGVELRAEYVAEEIAEPAAGPGLVVQVERLVVVRERSERAQLELVGALRRQGRDATRQRESEDRECSQATVAPLEPALREEL